MLNDRQMVTLRKIAVRLRELKPYLERIGAEVDEERTILPERLWRTQIDDEACGISCSLDFAADAIDQAIDYIAEVTGEDGHPIQHRVPPLPNKLPGPEEIDANRRREATAILERRRG